MTYGRTDVVRTVEVWTEDAGLVSLPQLASFSCNPGFMLIPSGVFSAVECHASTGTFGGNDINPLCVKGEIREK